MVAVDCEMIRTESNRKLERTHSNVKDLFPLYRASVGLILTRLEANPIDAKLAGWIGVYKHLAWIESCFRHFDI